MSPTDSISGVQSELVTENATHYLNGLLPPRPPELVAMEEYAARVNFPIIGPLAGQFCYQMARIMGARRIFEMGSGYGYSTAWFARAVKENGGGRVHHVVWSDELSQHARRHLASLGLTDVVEYRVSEAVAALGETDGEFDIIFCDINKDQYPAALPAIRRRLRPGGVLIADNAWWFGRVAHEPDRTAPTEGMRAFTRELVDDPAWIVTLVPLRDGLLIAYRGEQRAGPGDGAEPAAEGG